VHAVGAHVAAPVDRPEQKPPNDAGGLHPPGREALRRAGTGGPRSKGVLRPRLRAGFLTSEAETGVDFADKSVDVLSGYVRRVDLFWDHAGAGFL